MSPRKIITALISASLHPILRRSEGGLALAVLHRRHDGIDFARRHYAGACRHADCNLDENVKFWVPTKCMGRHAKMSRPAGLSFKTRRINGFINYKCHGPLTNQDRDTQLHVLRRIVRGTTRHLTISQEDAAREPARAEH
ncbi:hypothetical protein EJB05_10442 [Eragrostis curvula]|uniref:Uncharacterized protein n=1 Tax=Eragrostis curvula TaxID=38414 RepID=A0A5J9VL45_9POAL|nr:hypothetical protein EJB05_10442 [Eragrostis curvula]